jgi:hypothetical protein
MEFGITLGEVLSAVSPNEATAAILLRPVTGQDELLEERLTRYKEEAIQECRQALVDMNCSVELLDVDHLFDGRTLIFYFLGELPDSMQAVPDQLAKRYEKRVRTTELARLLEEGCGPGCGTEKSGCSSSGCAICLVAGGCSSKHKRARLTPRAIWQR